VDFAHLVKKQSSSSSSLSSSTICKVTSYRERAHALLPGTGTVQYPVSDPHFSPKSICELLAHAKNYGERTWSHIHTYRGTSALLYPLLHLAYTLEEHTQNIVLLSQLKNYSHTIFPSKLKNEYNSLQAYYNQPELLPNQYKPTKYSLSHQLHTIPNPPHRTNINPFDSLTNYEIETEDLKDKEASMSNSESQNEALGSSTKGPEHAPKVPANNPQKWAADASVSCLSNDILQHLHLDQHSPQTLESTPEPMRYETQSQPTIPTVPTNQRIRFNLISQRNTTSDSKTIQLFKSFVSILRDIDQYLTILPVSSQKQHLSALTNHKQITATDDNKMLTYFTPYYKKQFYSLSGYFHVSSSLTFEALQQNQKVNEWLEYNRYYMKLCPNQEEEMVQIGALCFSSIFIYRDDLKQSIIHHPLWTSKHANHPPIFELYTADFTGSSKKTKMLFISAEKSKQNEVAAFF
jgi:hypothetical protein